MVKYNLSQNGEIIEFNKINSFAKLKNNDLRDIIKFTGFFKSGEELKLYLQNHSLIKTNDQLKITYNNKGIKNLKYGVSYKDDLPFLSEKNIKIFLQTNKNNYALLETLCNHFEKSYTQGKNLVFIKRYMALLQKERVALDDQKEITKDMDYVINDIVTRECHRYDSKNKKIYPEIYLRGMRDFGMFLSRYYKSHKELIIDNLQDNEFTEYVSSLDEIEKNKSVENGKVLVKNMKKYNPNQMTLADFGLM